MANSGNRLLARVVLDTSAYSRLRAGNERVLDIVVNADVVYLPTIVLGELTAGFRVGRHERENRQALAEFLDEAFVAVIDVTAEVSERYGELFGELRERGRPVPTNDLWVAACAKSHGAHLVTFDRHFSGFKTLDCLILSA